MIVNIEKTTNRCVDVNQNYDSRSFDNVIVPDSTIPNGERPDYYKRLGDGSIVRLSQAELESRFENEKIARLRSEALALVQSLVTNIQALPDSPQKTIITDILRLIRKLTLLTRLE